jgi:hypothetical protein
MVRHPPQSQVGEQIRVSVGVPSIGTNPRVSGAGYNPQPSVAIQVMPGLWSFPSMRQAAGAAHALTGHTPHLNG